MPLGSAFSLAFTPPFVLLYCPNMPLTPHFGSSQPMGGTDGLSCNRFLGPQLLTGVLLREILADPDMYNPDVLGYGARVASRSSDPSYSDNDMY
jgi:hypothetical protein